jgi:hypothetical protein
VVGVIDVLEDRQSDLHYAPAMRLAACGAAESLMLRWFSLSGMRSSEGDWQAATGLPAAGECFVLGEVSFCAFALRNAAALF